MSAGEKRGRPKKPPGTAAEHRVYVNCTSWQMVRLDEMRGKEARSAYLKRVAGLDPEKEPT